MPNRIKVLIFMSTGYLAGFEKTVYNLVSNIDKNRFDVSVCILYGEGIIGKKLMDEGTDVTFLKHDQNNFLRTVRKFFYLVKQNRYDILYLGGFKVNMIGRIIGKAFGCKIIAAQRSAYDIGHKFQIFTDDLTTFLVDMFITNTEAGKNLIRTKPLVSKRKKIAVIYNGIDTNKFSLDKIFDITKYGFSHQDKVLGVVANLIPYKGHKYFFEAVKEIKRSISTFGAILVGDGTYRDYLISYADELGIKDHIRFLGIRDDVAELLTCIDILVLPSLVEGMPNAIMEAMAARKPVVATSVGGVPELVIDGETGYIVPPGEPSLLAEKIVELFNDEEKRIIMGEHGFNRIQKMFTIQTMVNATEVHFVDLISYKE